MKKGKILLGMSGGVDSSVAAALLLKEGYDVHGVTIQTVEETDFSDAAKVADFLGIPYYIMDLTQLFKDKVINTFKQEYISGKTPNPCILCNKYIKFGELLKKAESIGIEYIATGHYAKTELYDNRYVIKKAVDESKDQTYVLYILTQEQLSHIIMPLGGFTKGQVRIFAKDFNLPITHKKESQDICFVKNNDYGSFIANDTDYGIAEGDFTDTGGNILGRHKGIVRYTIGQRKGLGISLGKPAFVLDIDAENNRVILGDESEVFNDKLTAANVNYVSIEKPDSPVRVSAKIRYSAREANATLYPLDENRIKFIFDKPQRAITPGQSAVFYQGELLAGGGIIEKSI